MEKDDIVMSSGGKVVMVFTGILFDCRMLSHLAYECSISNRDLSKLRASSYVRFDASYSLKITPISLVCSFCRPAMS